MPKQQSQELWWQVSVPDSESVTGESLSEFISLILQELSADVAAIVDADWLGVMMGFPTRVGQPVIVPVRDLQAFLPHVAQISWGHFFFTADKLSASQIVVDEPMVDSIGKSIFSVSAIDSSFFYLYCQDDTVVNSVQSAYEEVECSKNLLKLFDFPV